MIITKSNSTMEQLDFGFICAMIEHEVSVNIFFTAIVFLKYKSGRNRCNLVNVDVDESHKILRKKRFPLKIYG